MHQSGPENFILSSTYESREVLTRRSCPTLFLRLTVSCKHVKRILRTHSNNVVVGANKGSIKCWRVAPREIQQYDGSLLSGVLTNPKRLALLANGMNPGFGTAHRICVSRIFEICVCAWLGK